MGCSLYMGFGFKVGVAGAKFFSAARIVHLCLPYFQILVTPLLEGSLTLLEVELSASPGVSSSSSIMSSKSYPSRVNTAGTHVELL